MTQESKPALCSECGGEVEPRALRCRHCGAAFKGARAATQTKPVVEELDDGVGMGFGFEDIDDD